MCIFIHMYIYTSAGMGANDKKSSELPIIAAVVVVVLLLFWMLKPSKKNEKYNNGNNIDFRKTKTDKNLPNSVMPHSDVPNNGSPFIIIDN